MSKPQDIGGKWEADFAKRIGGELVPGSGNKWYATQDVGGQSFLWQLKSTSKESLRVTADMLFDVIRSVIAPGGKGGDYMPGVALRLKGEEFIILRANDFYSLMRDDIKIVPPTKREEKIARAGIPKFLRPKD